MKIKINTRKATPLLKRIELSFEVNHDEIRGTPSRFDVRKNLADVLNKKLELVYIQKMETKTGTMTTFGSANVYDSLTQAKLLEPEHILNRNVPPDKQEKEDG